MEVPLVTAYIDEVEWWPVYELTTYIDEYDYATKVQIPESLLERYNNAYKEFQEVQTILRKFDAKED